MNIHYLINKYKEKLLIDDNNKYYQYIYDDKLNVIGKINIDLKFINNELKGEEYLLNEIQDNYKKFIN